MTVIITVPAAFSQIVCTQQRWRCWERILQNGFPALLGRSWPVDWYAPPLSLSIVIIKPFTIVFHHMCDKVDQVTGVYTTNTTEAVHYQLKHSMTNIAVVDGRAQLEKVDVDKMIDNDDHIDDYDLMVMMMSLRC